MSTILTDYKLFNKDVNSLIKDYMGENTYQLNYKKVIEEYHLNCEYNNNNYLTVWVKNGVRIINYRWLHIYNIQYRNYDKYIINIYSGRSIALLPKNYY